MRDGGGSNHTSLLSAPGAVLVSTTRVGIRSFWTMFKCAPPLNEATYKWVCDRTGTEAG